MTVYGANAVLELLRSDAPVERVLLADCARAADVSAAAGHRGVPVDRADRASLDRVAGSPHHQGAVATAGPYRYAPLDALTAPETRSVVVLDGIQDPRNLGAILRTARAAGVGGVVVPTDRCARITPVVAAASAGLLFGLPIAKVPNLVRAMENLKRAGFWLIGLVPRDGRPLYGFAPPSRPALVIGGEGEGLRHLVRSRCDFEVTLPMADGVESLNVAVAAGVAMYEVLVRPTHT